MRKILSILSLGIFTVVNAQMVNGAWPIIPTDEASRNFAPLMQYEFDKKETLDFQNDPEAYKQKREAKDKYLDYQEGKVDVPQDVRTQFNLQNSRPGNNNLKFIKDENGNIKIQGF